MKKIGLLGGMSWESTLVYYRLLNQMVRERLGGNHSAHIVINSLNFESLLNYQQREDWEKVFEILRPEMQRLEHAGADVAVIASNTIHLIADWFQEECNMSFIFVGESVSETLSRNHHKKVGLLGTALTMKGNYFKNCFRNFGMELILPGVEETELLNKIIFEELCRGKILEDSRRKIIDIIKNLQKQQADAVLLACTELSELNLPDMLENIPVYDSLAIHCHDIVDKTIY